MKSNKRGFGNVDIVPDKLFYQPDISEDIQQSLSRLLGWDALNEIFKLLGVDAEGRLLVSSGATKTDTITYTIIEVETTATLVVNQNNNRKQYLLQNLSGSVTWIGFDGNVDENLGYKLAVDASFGDDVYVGAIYALNTTGNANLLLIEWS